MVGLLCIYTKNCYILCHNKTNLLPNKWNQYEYTKNRRLAGCLDNGLGAYFVVGHGKRIAFY